MIAACRRYVAFASAVLFLLAPGLAPAGTLLAACQPRTARGEPAALFLREISLTSGETVPGGLELPGQVLTQALHVLLDGRAGFALTERVAQAGSPRPRGPRRELAVFTTTPLHFLSTPRDPAWQPVLVLPGPFAASENSQLLAILERPMDATWPGGRVSAFRVHNDAPGLRFERAGVWELPDAPVAAAADWVRGHIYIVSDGTRGPAVEIIEIDLNSAAQRSASVSISREDTMHARPAALALSSGGARLCLLMSAYSLEQRDGRRVSATQWIDVDSLEAQSLGPQIAGLGEAGLAALVPGAGGTLWARTYDEAGGFAYATSLTEGGGAPMKLREESFREAAAAPGWAASPDALRYALSGGKSVRILREVGGDAVVRTFPQPVESVAWGASGLFIGEGPRIHRLDTDTAASVWSREMAEGFVAGLVEVPGDRESPAEDLPPTRAIPARVELDADTPGLDLSIGAAGGGSATQRIEISALSLGGWVRTIEWQSRGVPRGAADALMTVLAAPPLHFSHRIRRTPFSSAPRGAAAVVVRLEDVARGAITRQVLLDYVSGGGGLLVLAGHAPDAAGEGLRRWLEPLGLILDPAHEVKGRFAVPPNPRVNLGLDQLSIAAGAYMEVTRPMDLIVEGPAPGTAVLALMRHGYGRLGVMSGEAPLGARALAEPANRRFVRALFGWLAGMNSVVRDSDHDGLRDDVEDVNANGAADRGETDFLQSDADGDGVPDGAEDFNLNGAVDEGETDPRRADTDGDGIPDGADAEPLPRAGSPILLAVRPTTGPAEGGTLVEVEGRNLPVNPQVWFGGQKSKHVVRIDSTRLVAAAPPTPNAVDPAPVPLRVAHPLGILENTLDAAFRYGDPTPVHVTLEALDRVRRAYDGYRGSMALTLDLAEVRIDNGWFYVRPELNVSELQATFARGDGLIAAGRDATITRHGARGFRIVLGPGEPLTGRVELGTFSWTLADPSPEVGRIRWYIAFPIMEVQWGGVAEIVPSEIWTDLEGAAAESLVRPAVKASP